MTHRKLCEKGAQWLHRKAGWRRKCQFVCLELVCQGGRENPDIFGFNVKGNILIEVKVSRSDFKRDFKKVSRTNLSHAIGAERYYLVPAGMVKPEEVLNGWGLIECDGNKFAITKDSERFKEHQETVNYYYHSILRREVGYKIFDYRKNK